MGPLNKTTLPQKESTKSVTLRDPVLSSLVLENLGDLKQTLDKTILEPDTEDSKCPTEDAYCTNNNGELLN